MSRHIPIAQIARALCPSTDLVKALAMVEATEELRAYFDDSGTHGESLITTISGFVAPTKVWENAERDWRVALADYKDRYGVTWYHATDVYNWDGEWRAAPLDVCRAAPMQFAAILAKQNVLPVWSAVVNEDFYKYATPEFLDLFPAPFDLCFHEAMGQLYRWGRQELNAPLVVPLVAHGDYAERIRAAHARYRNDGDFSQYIGPIAFDSPRCIIPLQTADLLAYEFYHWWKDTEYPRDPRSYIDRPVLHKAIERNHSVQLGGCYSGDGMHLAVTRHTERWHRRKGVREG